MPNTKALQFIPAVIYAILFYVIYDTALHWLVLNDWEREAYSYCYFIPVIVAGLIWLKREELARTPARPSWMGLLPLLPGLGLYWLGELGGEFLTLYLSMWCVAVGLIWLHLGWAKLKVIAFPLVFALTMFPLPNFLMTKLTFRLQLLASKLGSELIQLLGMPVFVEGNVIQLEYTKLQVVEACSGLNSLISLFVLTLLLTYFFRDHIWKRAVLLLSAVPLAISLNGMRIAMTAVLYKYWGPAVADGFFHSFSGMVMFLASLPLLLAEMWILQQLPPRRRKSGQQPEGKEQEGVKSAGPDFRQWVPQFLTAGIL